MFVRTTSLISRSLRNNTKFYSHKSISNLLVRSKNKMNNSSHLVQQHEASEALLLCSSNNSSSSSLRQYVTSTHNSKDEMKRWSWTWWKEWTIIIAVFGITGSTTVRIVRPIVTNVFGVEGSFLEGPWSYRLTYLSITLPLYSIILLGVGTIFRRHNYFKRIVFRMWGRFIPNRLINNNGSGRNNPGGGGVV
ncbi:uncharacterized protein OCT59_023289 [Rhizophagus irregularis]|uniref:DUF6787 domain-containing protein n=4 Tax=Rhizophagus irregularis TaxID=588596 RepID=U9UIN2_RHIID|nr:hypothetical protein GLOIN_2v683901 [Rhizophagus irregularis DAOM 181602=DAOM 197198]EXX59408.1 hypothetical protein RirG_189340 [Rhizophagus irregularis DAOM 197198w]UZO29835.1 hypothetical protein OCT59_023289 [Rhizophagus irregularis]POG61585.1 hypothetical protein GLOIN_2v683901 [Rhizophagus irregularis DAOM 181602=DAOM 197198]CAB4489211.1 unnamed protein product [Rhizophagus irregularis]CAB5196252.1 unnamed protein product [Rhizophagus irregularis]|eukprot:XP_025168451.1 hypothetical protein GLOIN_2v683901 [Rhizophagus irregularis DAOM 181602=DAOM 197198]